MSTPDEWGPAQRAISPSCSSEGSCTPDTAVTWGAYDRMCQDLDVASLPSAPQPHQPPPAGDLPCWSIARARGDRPSESCCMTAVRYGGSIIYFGGGIVHHIFADLYEYKVQSQIWTRLLPKNHEQVTPVLSHTATVHGNHMLVFGGMAEGRCINTIHRLDLEEMCWSVLEDLGAGAPCPRKGHTAVTYGSAMYVLMGAVYTGSILDDLHKFDIPTGRWQQLEQAPATNGQRPPALTGHSAAVHNDTMMVFGGMTHPHGEEELGCEWTNGLYAYHFGTQKWREVLCPAQPPPSVGGQATPPLFPPGRYSHVCWVDGESFYIFGGDSRNCTVYYNDVWAYSVREGRWQRIETGGNVPAPRSGLCAVVIRGMVLLFGGERPPRKDSDLVELNTSAQEGLCGGPSRTPTPLGAPTASQASPQPDLANLIFPSTPPPKISELRVDELLHEPEECGPCAPSSFCSPSFPPSACPVTPISSAPSASFSTPGSHGTGSEGSELFSPHSPDFTPLIPSLPPLLFDDDEPYVELTPQSPELPSPAPPHPISFQQVPVQWGNGGWDEPWEWQSNFSPSEGSPEASQDEMEEHSQVSDPLPLGDFLTRQASASPEVPVEYSNNVFQLPLFVDPETSLQELAARNLVRYNPYHTARPFKGLPKNLKQEVRAITPVLCTRERALAAHLRRSRREGEMPST